VPEVRTGCAGAHFRGHRPGVPPHEAVRIFIRFERVESAVKAAVDLDGRFFGGGPCGPPTSVRSASSSRTSRLPKKNSTR